MFSQKGVYVSKNTNVGEYELIGVSDWIIYSTSKSLDDARSDLIDRAISLRGNAILYYLYSKRTESESTTGGGTYYYSVFDTMGVVAIIGRKSPEGEIEKEDLQKVIAIVNDTAERTYKKEVARTKRSRRNGYIGAVVVSLFLIYLYFYKMPSFDSEFLMNVFATQTGEKERSFGHLAGLAVLAAIFFGINVKIFFNNYMWWLRRR